MSAKRRCRALKQVTTKGTDGLRKSNEGPAVPPQATEEISREATHAHEAMEDVSSAAQVTADEYRHRAQGAWQDVLHRARSFQDDSKQYVRENPTKAVFTALGVGFVLGLISLDKRQVNGWPGR